MESVARLTKGLERVLSRVPISNVFFSYYYKDIVDEEIEIAKITNKDRVLCIGGGPIPATALRIAKMTGAYVDVVDIDPMAIEYSKRFVKKIKMDDAINIFKGNGEKIDPNNYTVIHIARQAQPHVEILKNILHRSSVGTKILLRSSKQCFQDIFDAIYETFANGSCHCIQREICKKEDTLLFIKRGGDFEKIHPVFNCCTMYHSVNLAD
ncbi:MAG: hypothetical protein GX214_01505 [Clostridiales bacterium]|nr:hypothetical protein [Clostridiales bacterium]